MIATLKLVILCVIVRRGGVKLASLAVALLSLRQAPVLTSVGSEPCDTKSMANKQRTSQNKSKLRARHATNGINKLPVLPKAVITL